MVVASKKKSEMVHIISDLIVTVLIYNAEMKVWLTYL